MTIFICCTRISIQGSPKKNYNNHPFLGRTKDGYFALAHNGMGHDDEEIETMLYDTDLLKQCVDEARVCINEYY